MKPETIGEATGKHSVDLPGWLGAARGNRSAEEPGKSYWEAKSYHEAGINNREWPSRMAERLVVVKKRGNARGAKGPCRRSVESEERRAAWRKRTLRENGRTETGSQINFLI
jgi:hypothetical protein